MYFNNNSSGSFLDHCYNNDTNTNMMYYYGGAVNNMGMGMNNGMMGVMNNDPSRRDVFNNGSMSFQGTSCVANPMAPPIGSVTPITGNQTLPLNSLIDSRRDNVVYGNAPWATQQVQSNPMMNNGIDPTQVVAQGPQQPVFTNNNCGMNNLGFNCGGSYIEPGMGALYSTTISPFDKKTAWADNQFNQYKQFYQPEMNWNMSVAPAAQMPNNFPQQMLVSNSQQSYPMPQFNAPQQDWKAVADRNWAMQI